MVLAAVDGGSLSVRGWSSVALAMGLSGRGRIAGVGVRDGVAGHGMCGMYGMEGRGKVERLCCGLLSMRDRGGRLMEMGGHVGRV
jgi:hypothetical protein